ncbi:reproductive homeobox 4G [Rattus norvegicus]|uniref:Reproductive homeobox 4G n=2 Tax=Rattus norvegicus TaxID=10116 RepID=Q4TU78_RAT|nr:reproductive homeobox 4G [Rattus norvegicus]AAY58263.1 reproductive homeobox on X chromosome 4 [Rattus norvegicus]|eukprot:NP_001020060.1 reproductive homeobox 4G [Rattus norvegicus]
MEHQNTNCVLHEGLDEDKEKLNGAKAQKVLADGQGRNEGESGQDQPGSEAAAAADGEGAKELSGEGGPAAGAAGLVDNRNQEDHGTRGKDQENEKQPEKPVPEDIEVLENAQPIPVLITGVQPVPVLMPDVKPVSVLVRQRSFHYKFTRWQLQEMERIFQQNHFIGAEERRHLARWIGVSEARVQNWFKGRREQYRRQQKL